MRNAVRAGMKMGRRRLRLAAGANGKTLILKGKPSAFLKGVDVPDGVDTVIIKSTKGPGGTRWSLARPSAEKKREDAVLNDVRVAEAKKVHSVDPKVFEPDARARAVLRGLRLVEQDLAAAGGTYGLEDVRAILNGISRQAIEKRVQDGSLLAVPGPSNRRRYPAVQFGRGGVLVSGLREVQSALPSRNPWTVLNFLVHPDPLLEGSRPIDLLQQGEVNRVVESASRVGMQGA